MSIFAVIPAYNEQGTIRELVNRLHEHVAAVIVVDDGSFDETARVLRDCPVTLLRHEKNQGKASALWTGMQEALKQGAAAVITLDADGQHRPEDVPSLIAAHREFPNALIIGARYVTQKDVPHLRRFANRFADFWISWAAGHWVSDSQCGLRVYPAGLLAKLNIRHDEKRGFVFESEAVIEAARLGYRTVAVPVPAIYLTGGRRSHFRPVSDIARLVFMVAGNLLARGLYLPGLFRALWDYQQKPKHGMKVEDRQPCSERKPVRD